jgi:peptide deformylase
MKLRDVFVQDREPEFDRECLHRRTFPVNIRLYTENPKYKKMITDCIEYMGWVLDQNFEDYQKLTGIAAANLGIPWNIIIITKLAGTRRVMINPEIVEYSTDIVVGQSNNPSLKLKNKIQVKRSTWVSVRYFDIEGKLIQEEKVSRNDAGLSIQHEVDSNCGIMITNRFLAGGGSPHELNNVL